MLGSKVDDLRQEIADGQVIAIVGAGVSIAATNNNPVASWVGLLRHGVDHCVEFVPSQDRRWADRIRSKLQSSNVEDLLFAAEKIQTKLNSYGGEFSRWLRDTVGDLKPERRDVIIALGELGVPIATTNYDSLIEKVTGLPAVTWRQRNEVERLIRGTERGVLHLHGHWQDPESVVLGIRSYERVLCDAHAQAIQQAFRAMKTLLFIGYGAGLADPNLGALLRWSRGVFPASEFRHYRLVLRTEVDGVQETHPPEERIYVLPYGDKHGELAPFLRGLRTKSRQDDDSGRRKEHREKVRRDLSDQLDRFFEDKRRSPREIAGALEIEVIPAEPAKIREAIVDRLLDREDSIPLLNGLIRQLASERARVGVEILENCMDQILPFHFSPKAVATASSCLNEKGGGFLNGVVMTKCGAELVMAAQDQSHARFDPKDPDLVGKPAISGAFPALGKISIDDDAKRFLASVMGTDSETSQARRLEWDWKDNKRKTYCIVRLPKEPADRDHALKVLERSVERLPQLPILVLTTESQAKDHEEEYLRVLRRRFRDSK